MKLVELTNQQFDEYAKYHPLNNYCQTSKYALIMSEYGFNYDYIGYVDDNNNIVAATLILTKRIANRTKYGYAPKGFLINYYDQELLKDFLNQLRKHYKRQNFIFIKFNPEIIIGETNKGNKYIMSYNGNVRIIDELKSMNVKRRLELKEFDLLEPKFNAYLNLKQFDVNKLNRNYRKKIRHGLNKGMSLTLGGAKDINLLYEMMKGKTDKPISYYRNFYNIFSRDNSIDLVFITVDYSKYLQYCRQVYDRELGINDYWNQLIQKDPRKKNLNNKMTSDNKLQGYKDEIIKATAGLKRNPIQYVAGALVIKHFNRVCILASGFDREFKDLNPNHFLHYAIFERYKPYFSYCDMNGVTGKFDESSQYHGLNQFKLKFDPTIYEFVGELDLICNERLFKKLIKTSFIEDEFNKKTF